MIRIYTVPDCHNCEDAKEHLAELGIEYEVIDLKAKENREARAYYRSLGIKTAPVIIGIHNGHVEWIMDKYDREELNSCIKMDARLSKNDKEKIKQRLEDLGYL